MCLRSWKVHNPSWKIIELNDKILESYIQIDNEITNIHEKHITKTSFSDIVRIFLLEKYGGCWCDATTFCNMSLDLWLPKYTQGGFFAFEKPGGDRLLSTWFLYSEPRHYLTTAWKKATVKYWKTRAEVVDYFWFHHLFGELCKDDSIFSESWESTPKLSAHPPHYLQTNNLLSVPNKSTIDHIQGETPVYKLTYKFNESRYSDNCTLAYLKNTLKVNFIHIGKCGGTTIAHNFHLEGIHYHLERNYTDAGKFIIWVRNPLKRFVSAFNMAHDLIHADTSTLDINKLTLDNCLAPARIAHKMTHECTFTPRYDYLILYFQNANHLAESITCDDDNKRALAHELMTSEVEHIYRGIGWYLFNGAFVRENYRRIVFVGAVERMDTDTVLLEQVIAGRICSKAFRENIKTPGERAFLSSIAVKNLLDFYRDTDYRALQTLVEYGLLDRQLVKSYYIYS